MPRPATTPKRKTAETKPKKTTAETKTAETKPKRATAKKTTARRQAPKRPRLLSGGNPQIAKADGDAPVQAYLRALPGWKRPIGERIDRLIERAVPNVKKAVKWSSPLYGIEGRGYFASLHAFERFMRVTFFRGVSLSPLPPGPSKVPGVRYLDLGPDGAPDDDTIERWLRQAAAIDGWSP